MCICVAIQIQTLIRFLHHETLGNTGNTGNTGGGGVIAEHLASAMSHIYVNVHGSACKALNYYKISVPLACVCIYIYLKHAVYSFWIMYLYAVTGLLYTKTVFLFSWILFTVTVDIQRNKW